MAANNYGVYLGGGTISNCRFYGGYAGSQITDAVGVQGDGSVIGCTFSQADIEFSTGWSIVANNEMYESGVTLSAAYETVIVGNVFDGYVGGQEGDGYDGVHIIGSCSGINISDNVFYSSEIVFYWGTFNNEFTINSNQMQNSLGILMDPYAGVLAGTEDFRLESFTISNNHMSGIWTGGDQRIQLGDPDADAVGVMDGVISGNVMNSDHGLVGPLIEITDRDFGSTSVQDGTLKISDNVLNSYGTDRDWAIRINGENRAAWWAGRTYEVVNNNVGATDGIYIDGGQMAVVSGNILQQTSGPTTPETWALQVCGQIYVETNEQAVVRDNFVSVGKHISSLTNKAIIYVDAPKGTVSGNVVEGHVIAGANGIDTALKLVTGAFNVFDNYYDGVGVRWAADETPLSNELVITGTGSTVGENGMIVDDSGGTSTSFSDIDSERWAMAGVVETKTGELEITWSTDIEVTEVEARVKVAPTGSSVIVDVHKNDTTTLYTTQASRPTIATSTKSDITTPDITSVTAGEPVRIDIDQKDSNDVAEGLTVTIRYRRV